MQRTRIASAVFSMLVALPSCSLLIDTNPDGVITAAGSTGKGKGGSSNAGGSTRGGASAIGGVRTTPGGASGAGTVTSGGSTAIGAGGNGASGAPTGIGGAATSGGATSGGSTSGSGGASTVRTLGGATTQGGVTGTSGATGVGGSVGGTTTTGGVPATFGGATGVGGKATGGAFATGGRATGGATAVVGGSSTGGAATGGEQSCAGDNQCTSGHCVSGKCCSTACGVCNSCSTGSCLPVTNGTSCGSGQVCSGGSCQAGCWIGGGFRASGETSGNCQICDPMKDPTAWSNNDGASVSCGSCGGSATCSNMQLGPCSKVTNTYWQDHDGDGYGNSLIASTQACTAPTGFVANGGDCDDSDGQWYSGTTRCETFDANTLTTCVSTGTNSTTSCADGCAGGQCRSFATVSTAGSVTCGTLTCATSSGCSFIAPLNRLPTCGTTAANWYETCDGSNDCTGGQVCCHVMPAGGNGESTVCMASGSCPYANPGGSGRLVCDTLGSACASGGSCKIAASYLSIYECQ